MLVYGDQSERADPSERLQQVDLSLQQIAFMPAGIARHSALVGTLIESGRILQGVADAGFDERGFDADTRERDRLGGFLLSLAKAVRSSWDSGFEHVGALPRTPAISLPGEVELRLPEGFAFYAVYPEAYLEAARRLTLSGPARVIGIRSIGTSLAAIVAAALDTPVPVTVRPHGDPFARKLSIGPELEQRLLDREAHYVIVDEGPGQSGSSFGAVADWLEQRGVAHSRIAFMPSHSAPPGPHASDAHRQRWAQVQRATCDFSDRLPRLLERWLTSLVGPIDHPLVDVSGGAWRGHVSAEEQEWPAAMPPWERRKFLARSDGETFLVKFAGLGAIGERKLGMARALHSAGLSAEPVGLAHGFLVERWCDGAHPLSSGEKPIDAMAAYLGARARLFPARDNQGASVARLLEMARRNVSLAISDGAAAILDQWQERVDRLSRRVVRIRTDNKLEPHEWLRTSEGRLLKTDALDHHSAHDLIGCQDLAWDVAGAIIEFQLDGAEARRLLEATRQAAGRDVDAELLEFYGGAYLAFRLGQLSLAAEMSGADSSEAPRLSCRRNAYAEQLQQRLLESTRAPTRLDSLVG